MEKKTSEIKSFRVKLQFLHRSRALSLHSSANIEAGWWQMKAHGPVYNTKKNQLKIPTDRHPQKFTVHSGLCGHRHFLYANLLLPFPTPHLYTIDIHRFIKKTWHVQGETVGVMCVIGGEKGGGALHSIALHSENWFWQLIKRYAWLDPARSFVFYSLC